MLLRALLIAGAPFFLYYGFDCLKLNYPVNAVISFSCALIFFIGLILTLKQRPLKRAALLISVFSYIFFLFAFILHFRVVLANEVPYFSWFVLFPMIFFMVIGLRQGIAVSLAYLVTLFVALWLVDATTEIQVSFSRMRSQTIICLGSATIIAFVYELIRCRTHKLLLDRQQELIRSENALERLNRTLEDQVKERTAKLREANQQLEEEIEVRVSSEKRLQESEKRYRDLFENLSDFIYFHDMEGNFVENNFAVETVHQYVQEDREKLNVRDLMSDEYRPEFDNYLKRIREKGKDEGCLRILDKKGHALILEYNNQLVYDADGNPIGVRGSARNVTERILLEKERKQLQEQRLRSQKMEALGTLAGGVAHDLNNVLSGIVSYPDLLLMQLPKGSPLLGPIRTIQKSGQRAADIVQDLLTLARRGVSTREAVNLNDIVTDYLQSPEFENLIAFHPQVQVKTNLADDLFNIAGSHVHLSKTVMNLISNAAEAMPQGGTVFISTKNQYMDGPVYGYEYIEEGDYVLLTVRDTGIGISPEDMQMVFEPFYTKKVMGRSGTGLGMAVVWGTVKDHGGNINIESTEGKGTTFSLYFPVTGEPLSRGEHTLLSVDNLKGNGEAILVVDDIKEQRDVASKMLSALGYTVHTVSSGEEAVTYVQENPVMLVVLDMIMDPGMDGLDTFLEILKIQPKQKAIIVSGFSETDRVKKAQELGAGQYVKKPFTMERLGKAVKVALKTD